MSNEDKSLPEQPYLPTPRADSLGTVKTWQASLVQTLGRYLGQIARRANKALPKDGTERMTGALPLLSSATALPTPLLPEEGQLGYRSDTNQVQFWDGAAWQNVDAGGGGGAPTGASYVVMGLDGTLTNERNLVVNAPLTVVDSGANAPVTLDFDETAALGNNARVMTRRNTGADVGPRRRLNFIEGANVTLTVADDAGNEEVDITIAAASGGAPVGASYVVMALDGTLTGERNLVVNAPLTVVDGGANGPVTLDFDETASLGNNARVAVRKNTGAVVGTRRRLNLIEGTNITLTVADDGVDEEVDVTIAASGGAGGPPTWTNVEVNLGTAPLYGGTFDITGLSGLTAGKPVNIMQAAGAYTDKGTREDEAEMDLIVATAYVLSTTSIRVFWNAPVGQGPVSDNIKFNYLVSA